MADTEKQILGRLGEDLACDFLEENGYRIVRRNVHQGKNELDIIAEDDDYIVFVEVKTRSCLYPESGDYGIPGRAVDEGKRKNTVKAAKDYMFPNYLNKQPRIDVIEVYLSDNEKDTRINHIKDWENTL